MQQKRKFLSLSLIVCRNMKICSNNCYSTNTTHNTKKKLNSNKKPHFASINPKNQIKSLFITVKNTNTKTTKRAFDLNNAFAFVLSMRANLTTLMHTDEIVWNPKKLHNTIESSVILNTVDSI